VEFGIFGYFGTTIDVMAWDKTLNYKYDDETTRELHVLNVYSDPNFIADLSLVAIAGDELDKILLQGLKTVKVDPDLIEGRLTMQDVASKYYLSLDEVVHFAAGRITPLPRDKPFAVNWDEYDDKDAFAVTLATDIKKEDFMQLWKLVKRKQTIKHAGKKSKRKPTENDKLIYAIFKARQRKQTFSKIFSDYQVGKLEGYSGSTNQLKSDDSLERYYRKYQPTKQN